MIKKVNARSLIFLSLAVAGCQDPEPGAEKKVLVEDGRVVCDFAVSRKDGYVDGMADKVLCELNSSYVNFTAESFLKKVDEVCPYYVRQADIYGVEKIEGIIQKKGKGASGSEITKNMAMLCFANDSNYQERLANLKQSISSQARIYSEGFAAVNDEKCPAAFFMLEVENSELPAFSTQAPCNMKTYDRTPESEEDGGMFGDWVKDVKDYTGSVPRYIGYNGEKIPLFAKDAEALYVEKVGDKVSSLRGIHGLYRNELGEWCGYIARSSAKEKNTIQREFKKVIVEYESSPDMALPKIKALEKRADSIIENLDSHGCW